MSKRPWLIVLILLVGFVWTSASKRSCEDMLIEQPQTGFKIRRICMYVPANSIPLTYDFFALVKKSQLLASHNRAFNDFFTIFKQTWVVEATRFLEKREIELIPEDELPFYEPYIQADPHRVPADPLAAQFSDFRSGLLPLYEWEASRNIVSVPLESHVSLLLSIIKGQVKRPLTATFDLIQEYLSFCLRMANRQGSLVFHQNRLIKPVMSMVDFELFKIFFDFRFLEEAVSVSIEFCQWVDIRDIAKIRYILKVWKYLHDSGIHSIRFPEQQLGPPLLLEMAKSIFFPNNILNVNCEVDEAMIIALNAYLLITRLPLKTSSISPQDALDSFSFELFLSLAGTLSITQVVLYLIETEVRVLQNLVLLMVALCLKLEPQQLSFAQLRTQLAQTFFSCHREGHCVLTLRMMFFLIQLTQPSTVYFSETFEKVRLNVTLIDYNLSKELPEKEYHSTHTFPFLFGIGQFLLYRYFNVPLEQSHVIDYTRDEISYDELSAWMITILKGFRGDERCIEINFDFKQVDI